jgi:hypothetical protein
MKRLHLGTVGIDYAIAGSGGRRIASSVRRSWTLKRGGTCSRVELRQAVERLVRNAIGCPVLTKRSEIVIKSSIFLGQDNYVIQLGQSGWRRRLSSVAAKTPAPGKHHD